MMIQERYQRIDKALWLLVTCMVTCSLLTSCLSENNSTDSAIVSQTHAITGRISDSSDVPVKGCGITLLEENRGFVNSPELEPIFLSRDISSTDSTGGFRFGNLPTGNYVVLARSGGYGAYKVISLSEGSSEIDLQLRTYGVFDGSLPKDFSEAIPSLHARIDELNRMIVIGSDGKFKFDSLPEGVYHFSLNLFQGSVDYDKTPLIIEVKAGMATTLSDTVFRPWTTQFKIGNGVEKIIPGSGAFGMLCADSIIARTRCIQYEEGELLDGMPFQCFPIGTKVQLELTVYDSTGTELVSGDASWLSSKDSLLTIAVH